MSTDHNHSNSNSKSTISQTWEQNFLKLKEFKEENGHCDIPYSGTQRYLAKWVGRLKSKSILSKEQIQKLNSISFDWRTKKEKDDLAWEDSYQRLVNYGATHHGDYNVPLNYKEDVELGTWVTNQRKLYNRGKMRDDRISKLNNIGFKWKLAESKKRCSNGNSSAYQEQWNTMFERLKKYKNQHGHSNVPYNFVEDKALGMWVSTQRRVYKKNTFMYGDEKEMSQDREDMLKSIGFDFDGIKKTTHDRLKLQVDNNERQETDSIGTSKKGEEDTMLNQPNSHDEDYTIYHI